MGLSKQAIEEFRAIYRKEFKKSSRTLKLKSWESGWFRFYAAIGRLFLNDGKCKDSAFSMR